MMKKQRLTKGGILEIPINNGEYYVYAQILKYKQIAFFDYQCRLRLTNFEILNQCEILFVLEVWERIIREGIWLKVGALPIRENLSIPPNQYGYIWQFNKFFIRDIILNKTIYCNKEDVEGLEMWRGCPWTEYEVEDRIMAHYKKEKCKSLARHYRIWETVHKYESLGYYDSPIFVPQENKDINPIVKKNQRFIEGGIIEISINGGDYYVYAQIIKKEQLAFFDFQNKEPLSNYDILNKRNILFVVGVYSYIITTGVWPIVTILPIRDSLLIPPNKYIYDWELNIFKLYNTISGEVTDCSRNDVIGLEICAVWDNVSLENRIQNYYNGITDIWNDSNYQVMALTE